MPTAPPPRSDRLPVAPPSPRTGRRWLLFVHQLPASPSNLRVRTWRRLQQLGAVPVKQAVYVLPDSPSAREDFEWLKTEVKDAGGDASVFVADSVDTWSDDVLVEAFRRARQDAYLTLAREIEDVVARLNVSRRKRGTRKPAVGRLVAGFRERLSALMHIDFFGSAGRDRVVTLLDQLEERTRVAKGSPATEPGAPADRTIYGGRLWITRPRPGVDRMSSAWLIRRFIDPAARFGFASDRESLPAPDAVPFDMFGVAFSHHGEGCTFETLCAVFGIADPAVSRLAEIVHDLDLKDGRFGAADAATVSALIDGLQLATANDDLLLERGITLFESLYLAFARATRPTGPRRVAAPIARGARASAAQGRRRSS